MEYRYNPQLFSLAPSASIALMDKARAMKAQGLDIISLAGGEPDFDTPVKIREELKRQLDAGFTHYTVGPGLPELRKAIAEKLQPVMFILTPSLLLLMPLKSAHSLKR